jgi:hypothetical protein
MNWFLSLLIFFLGIRGIIYLFWFLDQNSGQFRILGGNPVRAVAATFLGLFAAKNAPKNGVKNTTGRPRTGSEVWDKGPGFAMS